MTRTSTNGEKTNATSGLPGAALSHAATAGATFLLLALATLLPTSAIAIEPAAGQQQANAGTAPQAGNAAPRRWSLAFGGGLLSTSGVPSGSFTFDHSLFGSEPGEFDADYAGGDGSLYELSVGVRLRRRLALGLTWSESSHSDEASIAGRLPHPFLFGNPRAVEGTGRGLARDETALHLSLRWLARDRDDVQVALFAGPSQIDLDQDLVSAVRFSQTYPFDTATFTGVEKRRESGSAVGYHAGVDVAWYWNRTTGIGGIARWSQASIDLDAPDGRSVAVDGGGLQVVVDLRFRF